MKRQATALEKMFVDCLSDKGPNMLIEFSKLNNNSNTIQQKNAQKIWPGPSLKKIYGSQKTSPERYSMKLVIWQKQTKTIMK